MSFAFDTPDDAINALAQRLSPVQEATSDLTLGMMLAEKVVADRDSPPADVSAMDGYAIRLSELQTDRAVPVSGECQAGSPPPSMQSGAVVRIFTGAIIPDGCEAVVKREDTEEGDDEIRFLDSAVSTIEAGSHIRRAGENAAAGREILPAGIEVTPAAMAGLANFGQLNAPVTRPVRVSIISTGDEVVDAWTDQPLQPWQLRNSNQCSILAVISRTRFARQQMVEHVADDRAALESALGRAAEESDAIVLSGGVSKGDYDYVPDCIAAVGGEVVFHGLPIRPGKPILGAATDGGKLILGLPGNPVSATINSSRFLLPLLRRLAGQTRFLPPQPVVELVEGPKRAIPLHLMLLVRLIEEGKAEIVPSKGSGDLVALSKSDGYVSVPPGSTEVGPWPFFAW